MPFICTLFGHFYEKKEVWSRAVQCFAELDVLCSLACFKLNADGPMCCPKLIDFEANGGKGYIEL